MQSPQAEADVERGAADYADELRRWRERRGLSKKALAEQMAYDRSYVSHIEGRNLAPTEDFTRRAEEVLNTGGALWSRWHDLTAARGLTEEPAAPPPARDLRTVEFVAWLAEHSSATFRETYDAVAALAHHLDSESVAAQHARAHERASVARADLAAAIAAYYEPTMTGGGRSRLYRASVDRAELLLSVLVDPAWLGVAVRLGTAQESMQFRSVAAAPRSLIDGAARQAAITRLAEVEVAETVMMNNPLYRLLDLDVGPQHLVGTVSLADFASYALTADLLEPELVDALTARPGADVRGHTPLRDRYLPTVDTATALDQRECVGGPATLLAIARPARGTRPADYMLLVQERSSRVLNVAGKLAVIPKAFHQPTGEPAEEADLATTLARELEEELLGRQDLEQLSQESHRRADPLHQRHRSEAMAWLLDRRDTDAFRTECTAFGINLVTGNYEFACLAVIEEEHWWDTYGHHVEANWETMRVHRYSSRDTDGLALLATDPRWSNEGLFAFLEGLRRLADLDTSGRVATPPITLET